MIITPSGDTPGGQDHFLLPQRCPTGRRAGDRVRLLLIVRPTMPVTELEVPEDVVQVPVPPEQVPLA